MAVEILPQQFRICQEANGQFCNIPTPYQPLANPPFCITVLYAKNTASISARCSLQIRKSSDYQYAFSTCTKCLDSNNTTLSSSHQIYPYMPRRNGTVHWSKKTPIHILHLPTACSATSPNFYLPQWCEGSPLEVNISLDMANLNMINISSINFCIWQHLEKHWNESQLQHLASIPTIPVGQIYSHMAKGFQHITPFSPEDSTGNTDSVRTLFLHTGVHVTAIGSLIPADLGIFCCYFFWCQPARLVCWP